MLNAGLHQPLDDNAIRARSPSSSSAKIRRNSLVPSNLEQFGRLTLLSAIRDSTVNRLSPTLPSLSSSACRSRMVHSPKRSRCPAAQSSETSIGKVRQTYGSLTIEVPRNPLRGLHRRYLRNTRLDFLRRPATNTARWEIVTSNRIQLAFFNDVNSGLSNAQNTPISSLRRRTATLFSDSESSAVPLNAIEDWRDCPFLVAKSKGDVWSAHPANVTVSGRLRNCEMAVIRSCQPEDSRPCIEMPVIP